MTSKYSDRENKRISEEEYSNYQVGDDVSITNDKGKDQVIGTVREVIHDETGLDGYVVENLETKELTVLFQGSKAPGEEGSWPDWVDNDLPMVWKIATFRKSVTPQLDAAANKLNQILKDYPDSKVNLYAHSLGSMEVQIALARVDDITRIGEVHIYQGPNIYPTFTEEERLKVDAMKYRIINHVDQSDVIAFGYNSKNSDNAVGIVRHVDSKYLGLIKFIEQHMWGGYVFNTDGSLKVKNDTSSYEYHFSTSLDIARSGMYLNLMKKRKMLLDGLSKSEEIFLDSDQAQLISSGLSSAAKTAFETINKITEQAHSEAEAILSSTRNVPGGFVSSADEVEEAYYAGGIIRANIVNDVDSYFEPMEAKAKKLSEDFENLEIQIKSSIADMLKKDNELAGEFNEWNKMK